MTRISRAINHISDFVGRALSFLILPMILVIVYLVVMRYVFHRPPVWGFEVSVFIYGIHVILPGSFCLLQKSHVTVDILPAHSPPGVQRILSIFSSLVILFVSIVITYVSTKWAWQSTLILEHSIHQTAFNPPIWWFKWVVPFSSILMGLQAFGDLLMDLSGKDSEENKNSTVAVIDND